MKVKILEKRGSAIVFLLEDATPAFANALRRIMISEVPTLAIESIDVNDNGSVLFDEVIAHRLGLVPLVFNPKKVGPEDKVMFALDKIGPCMVYSGDLKSSEKDVKPVDSGILIVELLPEQALKLEATARIGTGKEHAKWQAANASYQYYPELEIIDSAKADKYLSSKKELFTPKGKGYSLADPFKLDVYKKCEEECDGIKITTDDTKFLFKVESISGRDAEDIISTAVEILEGKATEFKKQLVEVLKA